MLNNPFTPIFGGKPDFFFGRKDTLSRFDAALVDRGSEDRALFITGARGNGKTVLVEQLSQRAHKSGWLTIDLGSESLVESLLRRLVPQSEQTVVVSPSISMSVLGTGGGISAGSKSKTMRYGREDLQIAFQDACKKHEKGIFVSIDEVQKVPLDDMSCVCEAFQMSSRKGYEVILVVAGLPYAYDQVIHHEGCTFMRRSVHESIGLFTWEETILALREAFDRIGGLVIGEGELECLARASLGHPYIMQLLGYYLVSQINSQMVGSTHTVTVDDVERIVPMATAAFERRALRPMVDELSGGERSYLVAMSQCVLPDRTVNTSDVASALGREQKQLSRVRGSLLRKGIILSSGYGKLRFNVPYLASYIIKRPSENADEALARAWRL